MVDSLPLIVARLIFLHRSLNHFSAHRLLYQASLAPSLAPTTIIRPARRLTDTGVGFLGDLNYTVTRRLNDTWWLRLGYNMIWLSGVALAPDQWDFTNTATSGTTLVGGGGLFLHGVNLGLESRW